MPLAVEVCEQIHSQTIEGRNDTHYSFISFEENQISVEFILQRTVLLKHAYSPWQNLLFS